jgi:hypothetical protein
VADTDSAEATALATELVTAAESVATESDTAVLLPSHSRQPIRPKPHKMPNTPLQRKRLNRPSHRWPHRPLMQPIRFVKILFIQIENLTELILVFIRSIHGAIIQFASKLNQAQAAAAAQQAQAAQIAQAGNVSIN